MIELVYDQAVLPPATFVGELHQKFTNMLVESSDMIGGRYYIVSPVGLTLIQSGDIESEQKQFIPYVDNSRGLPITTSPLSYVGTLNGLPVYVDPYRLDRAANEVITDTGVGAKVIINAQTVAFV